MTIFFVITLSLALIIIPEINASVKGSIENTNTTANDTVSIISIQQVNQQGNPVTSFGNGTDGFVKVTLASQSNQPILTTVDLIGSDLTSLGVGSVKTILNQTGSEMTLSFFIPEFVANGVSNICVDVFSDWPAKGGIPLATESCQEAKMSVSTIVSSNKSIGLQEEIRLDESLGSNNDFGCINSPSNKTEEIQLNGDNYLQQTVTITSGQRLGPLLVQKVCPDHVEGKQFFSNPLCCPSDPLKMYVGDSVGGPCDFGEQLTLLQIQGSKAIFSFKIFDGPRECPICLSGDDNIDTPNGTVNVKELKTGMSVWTSDLLGHRQFATILKTGKTLVPLDHKMVHIVLADGRDLYASEGHPTSDGRLLGELAVGDILDHSQIKSIELASYNENYTYDILPSGTTGYYWANEILVGSTLK